MKTGIAVSFAAVLTAITGSFTVPMVILLLFMALDYIFGILDSIKNGKKFSPVIALWGLVKKIGNGGLVLLGILIDIFIAEGLARAGVVLPFEVPIASTVTFYLGGTEVLSCAKHLKRLGCKIPKIFDRVGDFLTDEKDGK